MQPGSAARASPSRPSRPAARNFRNAWTGHLVAPGHFEGSMILRPKARSRGFDQTAITVDLRRVSGRWLVDIFYSAAVFRTGSQNRGSCGRSNCAISGPADYGPQGAASAAGSGSAHVGAHTFLIGSAILGGLVLLTPFAIWARPQTARRSGACRLRSPQQGNALRPPPRCSEQDWRLSGDSGGRRRLRRSCVQRADHTPAPPPSATPEICRTLALAATDDARALVRAFGGQASPGDLAMYDLREHVSFLQRDGCRPAVLGDALRSKMSPTRARSARRPSARRPTCATCARRWHVRTAVVPRGAAARRWR